MNGMLRLDPCVGYLLVSTFAVFFAWAAYLKQSDIRAFTAVVGRYQLMPRVMVPFGARFAVLCEAATAALLLIPQTRAPAAIFGAAFCLLYTTAIGINLGRGRRDLDCGCSGPSERRPISAWMMPRNLALSAALLVICLPWSPRPLNGVDLLTIGAGALCAALLYVILDSLMAINLRVNPMRTPS